MDGIEYKIDGPVTSAIFWSKNKYVHYKTMSI